MIDDPEFELLSRYIDNDLPPSEARDFRRRLENDTELTRCFGELKKQRRAIAALAACEVVPRELDRRTQRWRHHAPLRWSPSLALAASALVIVALSTALGLREQRVAFEPPPGTQGPISPQVISHSELELPYGGLVRLEYPGELDCETEIAVTIDADGLVTAAATVDGRLGGELAREVVGLRTGLDQGVAIVQVVCHRSRS